MKKHIVGVGNCQCKAVFDLLSFTDFNEKYTWEWYANWQMIANKEAPPVKALANADAVLFQPLPDVYGCYSTDLSTPNNMLSCCRQDAICISLPRIHINSLWPIYKKTADGELYGTDFLEYYKGQRLTAIDILSLYDSSSFDFHFAERYERNKQMFLEKETDTTVKIFDIIEQNLSKRKLFLTQDHPTTFIFYKCIEQIVDILDIEFSSNFDIDMIDDNYANLEDSSHNRPDKRYPGSTYSRQYYSFAWDEPVDDMFYRNNLQYCLEKYY